MSRLVTFLGLRHPFKVDFLNSNMCFCLRLYGGLLLSVYFHSIDNIWLHVTYDNLLFK